MYSTLVLFTGLHKYLLLLDPLIGPLSLAKIFFNYVLKLNSRTQISFRFLGIISGFSDLRFPYKMLHYTPVQTTFAQFWGEVVESVRRGDCD